MTHPAAKYNYRFESLYAALMAILFLFSVSCGSKVNGLPVPVLLPKEVKKKRELTPCEKAKALKDGANALRNSAEWQNRMKQRTYVDARIKVITDSLRAELAY